MLRVIYVLAVLDIHKNCYGDLSQTNEWKQDFYRPRRNYPSQSQNENSSSQNPRSQIVFGSRLKPRVRIHLVKSAEANKSQNFKNSGLLKKNDTHNSRNWNNSESSHATKQILQVSSTSSSQELQNEPSEISYGGHTFQSASRSQKSQRSFESSSQNSFEINDLENAESQSFGKRLSRDNSEIKYNQTQNAFGLKNSQNLLGFKSSHKPKSLISFRSRSSPNGQYIRPFGTGYGLKESLSRLKLSYDQNFLIKKSLGSQNTFESNCNVTSNTIYIRKHGSNSVNINGQNAFKAPDYLPPLDKTTKVYKAEEYLPPKDTKTTKGPSHKCSDKHLFITTFTTTTRPNTTRRPYYPIDTITKHPFYITTITKPTDASSTTKKPYYIPIENQIPTKRPYCHSCASTSGPFYIPVTKPATAIPKIPSKTDQPGDPTMRPSSEDTQHTTTSMATTSGPIERGDVPDEDDITTPRLGAAPAMATPVPPEPGDEPIPMPAMPTTTMPRMGAAPAMATPVPPEPDDEPIPTPAMPTTTMLTTASPSNTTVPNTTSPNTPTATINMTTDETLTTTSTPSVTTPDNNRHLLEEESSPTESTIFQGPEYLPPKDPTTMPTLYTTSSGVAPAMAMPVVPEPEDEPVPSPPTTTVTTLPVTSTTSLSTNKTLPNMTIPDDNRHLIEESSPTTPMTMNVTTPIPFKGPEYLPPKVPTSKKPAKNITIAGSAPAMAIFVPPEPDVPSSPLPPRSITPTDPNRAAVSPSTATPTTPDINFKAPEYLPPKETGPGVPPKPAMAMPVTSEPDCSLDPNDSPDIDPRSFSNDPCLPTPKTTTKPPFKGPQYLPPLPKTRIGRSSNMTLRLRDLEGTPRPVWYAGIYRKTTNPWSPICGGSIVRENVIISAAHCFWDDSIGQQPATLFAVAARKIYKPYNDPMDKRAQKSDVLDIKIPPRFLGAKTSFQEDLAILKLVTPFTFSRSIYGLKPICVDFDDEFDRQQMQGGHYGTIAGWGYTDAAGTITQRLLWLELPYIEIEKCIRDSEDAFLKYITCDKVCAGENDTGKALCRGDSGGGLAFWQGVPGHATPYLRGVASTAPSRRGAECNVFAYASFTHVHAHRTFLRDHVPDIEECRFWE